MWKFGKVLNPVHFNSFEADGSIAVATSVLRSDENVYHAWLPFDLILKSIHARARQCELSLLVMEHISKYRHSRVHRLQGLLATGQREKNFPNQCQ